MAVYTDPSTCSEYVIAYTPIIMSVVSAIIAGVVAYFVSNQARTAREKLRLDLYNRRFSIYERAMEYQYSIIIGDEGVLRPEFEEIERNFTRAIHESRFLFSKESGVHDILQELSNETLAEVQLRRVTSRSPQYAQKVAKESENHGLTSRKLLVEIAERLEKALSQYLDFHKITS